MGHRKEREEKICLNCQAELSGRYCRVCGQENVEPKESVCHLITHFIGDLTHFDGKFFLSLKYLLQKPGFLSSEYLKGRRASYLNPVRMYIFTSFLFFLAVFFNSGSHAQKKSPESLRHEMASRKDSLMRCLPQYAYDTDSYRQIKNELAEVNEDIVRLRFKGVIDMKYTGFDTTGLARAEQKWLSHDEVLWENDDSGREYKSLSEYDSVQAQLPPGEKDGWLSTYFIRRLIGVREYNRGPEVQDKIIEYYVHSIPKMMLVSLPIMSFFLLLLYIRRRKQFNYVAHTIFTLHIYVASFIISLLMYLLVWLQQISQWSVFYWLIGIFVLGVLFYQYKAMRKFYGQGRFKTIVKFSIFSIFTFILSLVLGVVFFVTTLLFLSAA